MAVKLVLRAALVEDWPEIARIRTSVRENHLSLEDLALRGITFESTAARMRSGELGSWVAVLNEEIAAFAFADKSNGNIWALFTDPPHEGKGCGSLLLEKCESWLKEQGLEVAILDTARKSKAAGFYARRGWLEYDADAHETYMRKQLV